jgi:hypothetical protein
LVNRWVTEGSFSLLRCLPDGEGASSTLEPIGAGWSWLIPMQPSRKRLKRTTNGSNLVTVELMSKMSRFSKDDRWRERSNEMRIMSLLFAPSTPDRSWIDASQTEDFPQAGNRRASYARKVFSVRMPTTEADEHSELASLAVTLASI